MSKPFRIMLLPLVIALASIGASQAPAADAPTFKVGVVTLHLLPPEPYDWRGSPSHSLLEFIWYPTDSAVGAKPQRIPPVGEALFEAAPAAANATLANSPAKFPLILLSHGTGGTAETMAWFATALASRGYIVASVNHPGNNALEPYTTQGFMLWWLRAKDLSAVLDDLLADNQFGPRIDKKRIGAAGFSLGGYTVIELAGGITSRKQFEDGCKTTPLPTSCKAPPEFADLIDKTKALAATDPAYAKALTQDGKSYREPRVRAVFAMAPAVGPAVTAASLKAIAIPVTIVAGESDSVVPVDANAKRYAAAIPHAALTIFPGGVDHYTFLDPCTDVGRKERPLLCVDRPDVDREAIHNATIDLAAKFFDAKLSAR
jgi:predicted dienelactone hydrolase